MSAPTSRLHRAALWYARHGWAVFPQASRSKEPITRHGHKDATTETAIIGGWWAAHPDANIGVSVGAAGLFVLDIDCKDGKPNGHETLAQIAAEHGDLPFTVEAKSGAYAAGRGRHFVFRAFRGGANTDGAIGPGIETKANGAFTVSPSLHKSGQQYEWVNPPSKTAVAEAPAWLVRWFEAREAKRSAAEARIAALPKVDTTLLSDRYGARALEDECAAVAQCTGGRAIQLNISAFKLGRLVGAGILGSGVVEAGLLAACVTCGLLKDDGQNECRRIIAGGVKDGSAQPREIPERQAPPRSSRPAVRPQLRVVQQEEPTPAPTDDHWRDELVLNADGGMKRQSLVNASLLVRHLLPGLFAVDEFAHTTVLTARPPWALNGWNAGRGVHDNDIAGLRIWLERQGVSIGEKDANALVNYLAAETHRHPVRDYLGGLTWDGTPRIDTWLEDYLGAPASAFHRTVAAKFMIAAVARVMRPGCKFDNMLVLEGDQGLGKSTAFYALFGAAWTSTGTNLFGDDKRMVMLIAGSWCVEIAELAAVKGRKMEQVKALITVADDKSVLMYAKRATRHRRQCVFVGTVNPGADLSYWDDESGARRLWPVPVATIDVAGINADRDQLWAEAVTRLAAGEPWWITDHEVLEDARAAQAERIGSDPWVDLLLRETDLLARAQIAPADVYERLGLVRSGRVDKAAQMRVAACLKKLGYRRDTRWVEGTAAKVWVRACSAT